MNKHNKLAKNAIRARKAKNKRANEQDKPKKGKRWLIRLGALIGCLLLVSALVVPCFADETSAPADVTVSYGFALEQFADMLDDRANNYTYGLLQSYYNGFGDSRFFQCGTLVSGVTDIRNNANYSVSVPLGISTSNDNQSTAILTSRIELDFFAFSIFTALVDSPTYSDFFADGYISVSLYYQNNSSMVDLAFYSNNEQIPRLTARYNGNSTPDGLNYQLTNFVANGITYTPGQLAKVESSFTLRNDTTPYLLSFVTALLYNRDIANYSDVVYSPSNFYFGLDSAYDLGYDDGERYGYAAGYNDGHADGYSEGLQAGMGSGNFEVAFQQGYDKAISEIGSGDFGRNLLGGAFSAPIDALREFTLIEWTTDSGVEVSIDLLTVFSAFVGVSLFVWFLKLFAGG